MQRLAAFFLAFLVSLSAGFADDGPDVSRADRGPITRAYGAKIASRVFSGEFAATRADALRKSGANIPGYDCKGARLSALIEALPYPVSPQSISWVERYLVDCEPRARRNLMLFLEDEKSRAIELLPGETKADPRLQRDSIRVAKVAASTANPPGCEKSWVTDTREIEPYKDGNTPWSESWKFDLCGKRAEVEMSFTPAAGAGTSFSAKLMK
ncbi:MAG TPA: hypothetical protein VKT73_11470 [Xanthobacteraceae bacterium]|nr:hypothetical protein [Xanthobacteraceae bacterium]